MGNRVPLGIIRANYTGKKTIRGLTCTKIFRDKKIYKAEFSDNTTISCPDLEGFYNALRRIEWSPLSNR